MNDKIRVLFIANYLDAMQRSLRYKGISADFLSGCSPFAMEGVAIDDNLKFCRDINNRPTLLNLRKNLSDMLSHDREKYCQNYNFVPPGENVKYSNDAEYIIVMNTCAAYRLSEKNGSVYSDTWPKNAFTDHLEKSGEYRQYTFPFPSHFNWKFYYDKFINALLSEYDKDHIILITTNSAQWYMNNAEICSQNSGSVAYRNYIEEVDRYFIEHTNCLCINEHYNHIPIGATYSAFRYSNPLSSFALRQIEKCIEDIVINQNYNLYRGYISKYFNETAKYIDTKLSVGIEGKSEALNTIEEQLLNIDGIKRMAILTENHFFDIIARLGKFLAKDAGYALSDYYSDLQNADNFEGMDVELVGEYAKYMKLNINDIIAIWMLYDKCLDKSSFAAIVSNVINNRDCLPLNAAKSFREANIEYLKNYPYIQPDLSFGFHSEKEYIYLDNNTYFLLDPHGEELIKKITLPIESEVDYKEVIENGYVCPVECADALCSNLAFYIERAKRRNGNTPVRIQFDSKEKFMDSINYIDYIDILENERFIISLQDSSYKVENYSARCNLEFLFEENVKICVIRAGFTDQMCSYIYAKRLEEKQDVKMYYDDTCYFLKNTFNGFEIDKIATEDLSNKRLSNLLTYKLLNRWVTTESIAGALYKNGAYALGGVGVDGRIKMFESCNRTLIPISGDNPDTVNFLLNFRSGFYPEYHHNIVRPEVLMFAEPYDIDKYVEFSDFPDEINKRIAEQMQTSDSVVVHIRLGDFASLGWDSDLSYFVDAINKIMSIDDYPNKKFFIFSDDIPWVRNHVNDVGLNQVGDSEIVYVDNNKGEESFRDMQLMTYAKIIIGSGSGFVRMAALLSKSCEMFLCYNLAVMECYAKIGRKNKYNVGEFSKNYYVDYSKRSPKSNDSARVFNK